MLEYFWSQWASWRKPATIQQQAPTTRRLIPHLELLEDRWVPTTAIAQFPVLTASSTPYAIAAGPDGNIWFTEGQAGQIGMINPTSHAISEFPTPTANSDPVGITAGPDGDIWFAEYAANQIGEINPTTHAISEFLIPTANSGPVGITAGPDGNIWFTENTVNQIGEINPTTHAFSEFPLPTAGSGPMGIAAGPDGNIWFTETSGNRIGTINPTLHTIAQFAIPQVGSQPYRITAGPDGNMWFTENAGNRIGAINPSTHDFTTFALPTGSSGPYGITAGADGNIWFVDGNSNQIGEFNLATEAFTQTALPTANAVPTEISAGPGGTLWFTESNGNQIGEVVATPTITTPPVDLKIVEDQTATFTAAASGFPTPTVHWQVSTNAGATFTPLTNAGVYSGVTTGTLTISDVTTAMSGDEYEAVFTNGVSPTPIATTEPATLKVTSVLSIAPFVLKGIIGAAYNQTLSVLGSTTPFSLFTVNSFNPGTTGLTASDITTNPINGTIVINGTPTAAGTATFTITVANTAGFSLTQNMVITIRPLLSITTASLPPGTAGMNYDHTIGVIGGVLPYTTFKVSNFNAGTTGLIGADFSASPTAGTFTVNGTPSAGGTATFTVNVTDSAGTVVTQNFTITINPPLVITPALPAGTTGTIYNQTLTVTGGGVPYTTFKVSNFSAGTTGLTAANLAINAAAATVTISGTPTAAGVATFTVNVVDAIGAVLNKTFTLTINRPLTITPSLPQGTAGIHYHHTITIAGGTTPYSTVTATGFSDQGTGLTAAALTVNASAGTIVINGTPTAAGTATFTVNVTDAAGNKLSQIFTITTNAAPTIGNLTTTQWTVGRAGFTGTLTIAGGTGPFVIAGVSGLPTGLSAVLTGTTIHFTGTPTATAVFAGSVTIHDAAGAVVTKTFTIAINATPTIGNLTKTQWTVGRAGFTGTLTIDGTAPFVIAGVSGLPTGLSAVLTGNKIHFTGTPSAAHTFAAGSITIRDAAGASVTQTFSITINPLLLITTTILPAAQKAVPYTAAVHVTGGTGAITFAITAGNLPPGMKLSSTGVITGVTLNIGDFTFTITATDPLGDTFSRKFTLLVT